MLSHTKIDNTSRTNNSIRNSTVVVLSKMINVFFSFIVRTLIINKLGIEILGIDGLFASVITVLSLADLGIGTAITYSLYKPIANQDYKTCAAYMNFFQKVYVLVGSVIFVLGLLLIPFLPYLINLPNHVDNLMLIYILTLASSAISYFLSSRRVIYEANQVGYAITAVDTISSLISQCLQVLVIVLFNDYVIVLLVRIFATILSNGYIFVESNKDFSYIFKKRNASLKKCQIRKLRTDLMAIVCHKIGGVFVTGTDNMLISYFIGTILTGVYSNYLLITNTVSTLIAMSINAITPSIGNLKESSDDKDHQYEIFWEVQLVNYVVSSVFLVFMYCLINPFITIWLGKKYIFDELTTALICVVFYISSMRYGVGAFSVAAGYFKKTVYKPILESIINLIVSLILVGYIGIDGIILGTLVSLILGSVWVDPYVVFKNWFKKPFSEYVRQYVSLLIFTLSLGEGLYILCKEVYIDNMFLDFGVKAIICLTSIPLLLLFIRTKRGYKTLSKHILNRRITKIL